MTSTRRIVARSLVGDIESEYDEFDLDLGPESASDGADRARPSW